MLQAHWSPNKSESHNQTTARRRHQELRNNGTSSHRRNFELCDNWFDVSTIKVFFDFLFNAIIVQGENWKWKIPMNNKGAIAPEYSIFMKKQTHFSNNVVL